jgi:hypothetical protein
MLTRTIFQILLHGIMVMVPLSCDKHRQNNYATDEAGRFEKMILNISGSNNNHPAYDIWDMHTAYPGNIFANIAFLNNSIRSAFFSPSGIPDFAADLTDEIINSGSRVYILHLLHKLDAYSAGGYGPPLGENLTLSSFHNSALETELLIDRLSLSPEEGGIGLQDKKRFKSELASCAPEFQSMILSFLECIAYTYNVYRHFLPHEAGGSDLLSLTGNTSQPEKLMKIFSSREMSPEGHKDLFNGLDRQVLAYSSRIMMENISHTLEKYDKRLMTDMFKGHCLEFTSSLGRIGIFGEQNDTVDTDYLLIINTGGDDFYRCNAASAEVYGLPISMIIDLEGNDKYGEGKKSNICRSVLGISVLIDLKGNDMYRSGSQSLAFSLGGFSLLEDFEGNDDYSSDGSHGLASSFFGYSMLIDHSGDDIYRSGNYSQGFGGPGGAALLLDLKGNDRYLTSNGSFCQGSARGRWADAGDGYNMGGGYGILVDNDGDDIYKSGSFSQAASYYCGFGILNDRRGNDRYNSLTHSQGAATHSTIACFIDNDGDDNYNCSTDTAMISQITGYGRDRSHAFFIDEKGNDKYLFGNKSFGVGDINATGVALDLQGDDDYIWVKNTRYSGFKSFGSAQLMESSMNIERDFFEFLPMTIGIASDWDGKDTYLLKNQDNRREKFFLNNKIEEKDTGNSYSKSYDKRNRLIK